MKIIFGIALIIEHAIACGFAGLLALIAAGLLVVAALICRFI